jgi:hypothetical protein
LVIGALVWPRGAAATTGGAAADLLESAGGYLTSTVFGLLQTANGQRFGAEAKGASSSRDQPVADSARQRALDASVRAESSFAHYLAERPEADDEARWARLLSPGNRLWYVGDLLRSQPLAPEAMGGEPEEILHIAEELQNACGVTASTLRHGDPPQPNRTFQHLPRLDSDVGLGAWLTDLLSETTEANYWKGGI